MEQCHRETKNIERKFSPLRRLGHLVHYTSSQTGCSTVIKLLNLFSSSVLVADEHLLWSGHGESGVLHVEREGCSQHLVRWDHQQVRLP